MPMRYELAIRATSERETSNDGVLAVMGCCLFGLFITFCFALEFADVRPEFLLQCNLF